MSELIVSMQLTRERSAALLLSLDGRSRQFLQVLHPPAQNYSGFLAISAHELRLAVRRLFDELAAQAENFVALVLCCERPAIQFCLPSGDELTPILFGEGLAVPAHAVPAAFAASAATYRASAWRQLTYRSPELAGREPQMRTLGSMLAWDLCGVSLDTVAGRPDWLPSARAERDELQWLAAGLSPAAVPEWQAPNERLGSLQRRFAEQVAWPSGLPVFVTSDPFACFAEGIGASPQSWAVWLGDGMSVGWPGPPPPLGGLQFALVEAASSARVENRTDENEGEKLDLPVQEVLETISAQPPSDLVDLVDQTVPAGLAEPGDALREHFSGLLESIAGPKKRSRSYRLRTVEGLLNPDAGLMTLPLRALEELAAASSSRFDAALLTSVPVGSDGLRFVPGRHHGVFVGMRAGHTVPHLLRALFEGMLLQLRVWRYTCGVSGLEPVRLVLAPPWDADLAPLAADILCEPLLHWPQEPALPGLLAQASLVSAQHGLGRAQPGASLAMLGVYPGARAEAYHALAGLHWALSKELASLL